MAKRTKTQQETEVKRGPGRPPSMPGETMKNHMVRVAEDVPGLIEELAAARNISRGALVTLLIRQAAARRATAKPKRAKEAAPVAVEAN